MALNLGGIGKEYAVDRVTRLALDRGRAARRMGGAARFALAPVEARAVHGASKGWTQEQTVEQWPPDPETGKKPTRQAIAKSLARAHGASVEAVLRWVESVIEQPWEVAQTQSNLGRLQAPDEISTVCPEREGRPAAADRNVGRPG
jgi:hypothetical protein